LQSTFHLSLSQSRTPVVLAYSISIIGSIGGGRLFLGHPIGAQTVADRLAIGARRPASEVLYVKAAHSASLFQAQFRRLAGKGGLHLRYGAERKESDHSEPRQKTNYLYKTYILRRLSNVSSVLEGPSEWLDSAVSLY